MPVMVGVVEIGRDGEAQQAVHEPVVDEQADSGERTYAAFNHYIGLLSLLDHMVLGLIGTLIMWNVKRKESPFLDDHGREALNFQLSLLLYTFAGSAALGILTIVTFGLSALLIPVWLLGLYILRLICCILAGLAANRGQYYRYPVTIRFLG